MANICKSLPIYHFSLYHGAKHCVHIILFNSMSSIINLIRHMRKVRHKELSIIYLKPYQ